MHEPLPAAPVRVGLAGFGYAGRTFHAPLITTTPGLELVAVASSEPARVQALLPGCAACTFPELVGRGDIDLIVIATPTATHHELARAALLAGRHVVVDKPVTTDLSTAIELVNLAAARGRVLTAFHNRRWDGDFLTLRDLLAAGTLGSVRTVESTFDRFRPVVRDRWRERPGPGSGLWLDLGPHLVDQALMLFGDPVAVSADMAVERDGAVANDAFRVTLRYPALRVVLAASCLAAAPAPRFRVLGTQGAFVKHGLDAQETCLARGLKPASSGWNPDPGTATLFRADAAGIAAITLPSVPGNYPAFYRALRDALLGNGPPPVRDTEILSAMRVLELAGQSARESREITLARTLPGH